MSLSPGLKPERRRPLPGAGLTKRYPGFKELKELKGKISFRVPMTKYTTMGVGGAARALCQPESIKDLIDLIRLCKDKRLSFLAIGSGSNIIVSGKNTKKIFIRLTSPFFKNIEVCGTRLSCGGGALLSELLGAAEKYSLGGAEFLVGIPGTVGGAIIQNAGAHGGSISDIVKDIRVLDKETRVRILNRSQIDFGYRRSALEQFIILGATFQLRKRSRRDIGKDIRRHMKRRLSTQDYTAPSAGCIFKNPEGAGPSAAELIERCGLKGKRIGGAGVSERHSNFIINRKNAKADEVLRLITLIKDRVYRQFGIRLEEEVRIIK